MANDIFPAGDQKVNVRIGQGEATETIALAAGDIIEKDIIIGVGRAVLNAFYAQGMLVEEGGLYVEIFKAARNADGSRDSIAYGYGPGGEFDVPAGDYVLYAKLDQAEAEAPFSVKVGERIDAHAVLNTGVLAISAPGADFVEVFGAAKDIQGNRKGFGYHYSNAPQTTLPAGDYVIVRRLPDGGEAEGTATVTAGERTEVTVP